MLDVQRREDVDAVGEELVYVLPSFRMARARRIGVRELIDEDQLRPARYRRVDVELREGAVAVRDLLSRQDLEAFEQGGGLAAPMGLDDSDDDVTSLGERTARGQEHCVGLADTRRRAKEDLELAAGCAPLLALYACEERIGVGAGLGHGAKFRRISFSCLASSNT